MGWWTRNRLIGVGAAVVVAVASGAYLVFGQEDHDESIEGPSGAYPDTMGTGAPTDPSQVVTSANLPQIIDGLRVEIVDFDPDDYVRDEGVVAFDLRTGVEYWSYRRDESAPSALATADGLLYVLWGDGLLVRFDPRTAEPLWHTELDDLGADRRLRVAGGVAVVVSEARAVGVDVDDGAVAWTAILPEECHLDQVLAVDDAVAVETRCEPDRYQVMLFDRDGEQAAISSGPTADLIHAGPGRFAITDLYSEARIYAADSGEQVATVPLPEEDFSYYRVGDGEMLIAENFHSATDGGPLYGAWDLARETLAWTVPGDAWSAEARPWLVDGHLYTLRREPTEGKLWELVVYDAATGEELTATEINLSEYLTVPEHDQAFSYLYDVFVRISDVGSGTVTVTIGDPWSGSGTSPYCEQCSLVFTE